MTSASSKDHQRRRWCWDHRGQCQRLQHTDNEQSCRIEHSQQLWYQLQVTTVQQHAGRE